MDLIIIGAGPAGITAAVYAARKKMDFTVISPDIGGQAAWSGDIENYTGYQFISGPELTQKFREHLEKYQFDLREGIAVTRISRQEKEFAVNLSTGEIVTAKTLVLASGKKPRPLVVPGEEEFKNKGVTYCATCDGPLFAGKVVAVIGGGNSALDAALQMMKISPQVYLINITSRFTGDMIMQEKVQASPVVNILHNTKVLNIIGDKFVKGLRVETEGKIQEMGVEGVFVEVGLIPNTHYIDFVDKNDKGEIIINCGAETSVPGIFAAGDVSSVPDKQIVIAAGEGAKAALAAYRYLSRQR